MWWLLGNVVAPACAVAHRTYGGFLETMWLLEDEVASWKSTKQLRQCGPGL